MHDKIRDHVYKYASMYSYNARMYLNKTQVRVHIQAHPCIYVKESTFMNFNIKKYILYLHNIFNLNKIMKFKK
jgi:hypothetical protein